MKWPRYSETDVARTVAEVFGTDPDRLNHLRYRAALIEIAAYDDKAASDHLAYTGSYSCFDEPGAVETARKALEGRS